MGVISMFACVLLCQTIIATSFAVIIPVAGTIATVVPDKPLSLPVAINREPSLSSPTVPSSDVILDCLRSMYLGTDSPSPTVGEYSSPLFVTSSSSRGLPIPKIETLQSDASLSSNIRPQSSISLPVSPYKNDYKYKSNIYPESSIQLQNAMKLASLSNGILPTVPNTNVVSLPSVNSLPLICLEALKSNINSLNGIPKSSVNLPTYRSFPENQISYRVSPNPSYALPYPLRYNQLFLPDVLTPSNMRPSTVSSINNLDMNTFNTLYAGSTYTPTLTKTNRVPQNSARISENPNSYVTTRVPTVPFSSSAKSFSEAQKLDNLRPSVNDPIRNRLAIDKGETISRVRDIDFTHITPDFNSWNLYYPTSPSLGLLQEPNIPDVKCLDFTPPVFNFEPSPLQININENSDFPNNFIIPDMQPTVDFFIDTIDRNFNTNVECFLDVPNIPGATPNFISLRESYIDNTPDLSLVPIPMYSNNNLVSPILSTDYKPNTVLEVCSPPTMKYPPKIPATSSVPATYINVSPSYSLAKTTSKAISSLNDVVSSLTRNILSSLVPYLASPKIPVTKSPSNPYGVPLPRRTADIPPSSMNLFNSKLSSPSLYSSMTLPKTSSYYEVPLVPIDNPLSNTPVLFADCSTVSCYDDIPLSALTYSNDITEPILDTISLPPLKVALLPPISFVDYIPLQPCPSMLPSPILPSGDTSSSIVVQPQVVKIKSLDRKYKTVDKLLQLVFLAELFHREDIDWDALDAVLAMLCAS